MHPVPMTRIDLAGTIRWIAAIIATIVALGLPLGYWVLACQFEAAAAQNTGVAALIALVLAIGVYVSLKVLLLRAVERVLAERKSAERDLAYLANHDGLTGLPNRNLFHDHLRQTTFRATRNKRLVALLYLDLDQFKMVNDSLGHKR